MSIQHISKIDAATRQLDLAIRLYFQDGDVIGVHTLCGAAHGILTDLRAQSAASGRAAPSVTQTAAQRSQRKYVVKMVHDAVGFLKHANRDPKRMLRFNPRWTDFLLYDAIRIYVRLTGKITHSNIIFLLWVTSKYPTVLLFDDIVGERVAELRRLFPRLGSAGTQKRTFLTAMENRLTPRL
jgi:hypothetical protein